MVKNLLNERCRLCRFQGPVYVSSLDVSNGCNYAVATHRTRMGQILKLLGVKELTPYAKWLLEPKHCIFFETGKRRKACAGAKTRT